MISISMLNVCSLPSKLDLPDFIDFIESHTINRFVETKINEIDVDNISIPVSYKGKFKCRKYCSKVKSGGMGIIYKGELEEFITEIKTDSDFVSWYRIDKTITGLSKDLLLGVVYIPPEGSKYTNVSAFEECELELLELLSCNDALVCMCGDFNARTGNLCDLVENNVFNDFGRDSVTGGLSTIMKNHYERKNNDKHCNKYGPLLTDLCKTANVLIVNGRMPHYSSGNPTFKNISTIDYFFMLPTAFSVYQ